MENDLEGLSSISSTIRNRRRSIGISQATLAKACGMSQSMVARLESDIEKLNPSYGAVYTVMQKLAESSELAHRAKLLYKKAHEIMHRNVIFLNHGDTVDKAISIIRHYDFAYIPVLNRSGIVDGTVYQKSLLELATNKPTELSRIKVDSIVEPALPKVDKDTPVSALKHILEIFGAVLVVDKTKAIGIITGYDVLKLL